jgi:hypothetical protein
VRCGEYNDLELARLAYVHKVDFNELTVADSGYKDSTFFINSPSRNVYDPNNTSQKIMKKIMARHESVNERIKNYAVMTEVFHRPVTEHCKVFKCCINLVQLAIENGEPLAKLNINRF